MAVANMSSTMKVGRLLPFLTKHLVRCFEKVILTLPVLLVGSPGIGKTEICKQVVASVAGAMGKGTVVNFLILHPVVKSDVDFGGHPVVVNGQAMHLTYGDLRQLIETTEFTVVLIDDVGQSKPSVQAALMQLVREREINGFKVSDKVQFILATNGATDKAGVAGLLRPLQNRCVQVTVEVDPDALANWLESNYPDHAEVAAFMRHRPGYIMGEFMDADQKANKIGIGLPTPRSVANVAEVLRFGHDHEDLQPVLVGLVGMGFATEFLGWMRVWKTTTKYATIVNDPLSAKLPTSIDGNYAQVGMLCQQVKRAEIAKVWQYVHRMGAEFRAFFWNVCEKSRPDLIETATYQEWRMSQKF